MISLQKQGNNNIVKGKMKLRSMKRFARINLSSVLSSVSSSVALAKEETLAKVDALRRGILVSFIARETGMEE